MTINKILIEIANFEIISSEYFNEMLFYFPEEDPLNLNFQECGVDSSHFILNMGFPLYIIFAHASLLASYFILYLVNLRLKLKCLGKINSYLATYLIWNGNIRLYIEIFQGMALASVLNMHTANWQSPFEWVEVSNYSGLVGLILVALLPILVFIPFYCLRRAQWSTVKF